MKCSFRPYEGQQEYIFVSYSHSNDKLVAQILERLNNEGFRIWYDEGIEWGTEWPESIAEHLRDCAVCLAFHSSASVVSPNCRQEINYALKQKKSLLSVYLENVSLSDGMDMQLSPFQSTFFFQYEDQDAFFERLFAAHILQPCRGTDDEAGAADEAGAGDETGAANEAWTADEERKSLINTGEAITAEWGTNIDEELNKKFKEFFGKPKKEKKTSPVLQKLSSIKEKSFMNKIESRLKSGGESEKPLFARISLVPIEYGDQERGKHFIIPDVTGYKTALFEIYTNVDCKTLTEYYTCEPIRSEHRESGDGSGGETTYYIDDPQEDGNPFMIFHFNFEKGEAFVNNGLLIGDEVRISKKPMLFKMDTVRFDDYRILCESAYDLDQLSIENRLKVQTKNDDSVGEEQWWDADILENATTIIDPETARPVKRELYYDETTKEWKARIKIARNKSYFAFQLLANGTSNAPLSQAEIAGYYRDGSMGFPRDALKAAEYYEKDGSAQSYYEIATLFRTDKELCDEETYLNYLQQAVEMGCEEARIELAMWELFSAGEVDQAIYADLPQRIEEKAGLAHFIAGYFTEKGRLEGGMEAAFQHYYAAAEKKYKPACARLGVKEAKDPADALRNGFMQSDASVADYCMGCVLFFGLDIAPDRPRGKALLEAAGRQGDPLAIKALRLICESDPECANEAEALTWLKAAEKSDPSLANELANRLLDGKGCEINEENDLLAFVLLQKAAEGGSKVAQNNLGWMYKNGRGTKTDYAMALRLFKEAELAASFYHLGEMYEHGLGVPANRDTAMQYYEKGASMGSKKAIKRLEDLKEEGSIILMP